MIYLFGGNGFIGSAFAKKFKEARINYKIITRDNFMEIQGTSCDLLINANGNSKKYLANTDPLTDFDLSTRSVLETLTLVDAKRYIYLSSGDVYPDQSSEDLTSEDFLLNPSKMSYYGLHKYLSELLVKSYSKNWLIFRLGGLVGPNLKKNPIFDIINDQKLWINLDSELQYLSSENLVNTITLIEKMGVSHEIINICGVGTIKLRDIYEALNSKSQYDPYAPKVKYILNLRKISNIISPFKIPASREIIYEFISTYHEGLDAK